jgi:hypothetical protein
MNREFTVKELINPVPAVRVTLDSDETAIMEKVLRNNVER